jgi:hypothetical protein
LSSSPSTQVFDYSEESPLRRCIARCLALVLTLLVAASVGCDSESSGEADPPSEPPRETFSSEKAPYQVRLPSGWKTRSTDALNPHADLAATYHDRLFLIVIPQELPELDGVEPPGVNALKEASLERMRGNVEDLKIEQEGPVALEKGEGTSVFAEGRVEESRVQYIATFVQHGHWGYQIIAWGPATDESRLVDAVDTFIGGWQFRGDSLPSETVDAKESEPSTP